MTNKILPAILICLTLTYSTLAAEIANDTVKGIIDAQLHADAANEWSWCVLGVGCGIFAVAHAALDTPSIDVKVFLGKSPEYIASYTSEYQSKIKRKRIKNSFFGWGAWIAAYIFITTALSN